MNPDDLFFSLPTFSEDLPPLFPLEKQPESDAVVFHEDDWSQLEFFPKNQLSEIQRILKEYKPFELANRMEQGWRKAYARKVKRVPVISEEEPVELLEALLGVKAGGAPILISAEEDANVVKGGFTFSLSGDVVLYGYTSGRDVPVLAAILGEEPDDETLVQAFLTLHASHGLILVDWEQQLVMLAVDEDGQIEVWEP